MASRAKSTAKSTTRTLSIKKDPIKDLTPSGKGKNVKAGRLPETKGCPYLPPK